MGRLFDRSKHMSPSDLERRNSSFPGASFAPFKRSKNLIGRSAGWRLDFASVRSILAQRFFERLKNTRLCF